ncbi:heparinase II/III family protein [Candidatus Omnitrophota bacterium]
MTDDRESNSFYPVLEPYTWYESFESGSVGAWSSYPPAQDTAYDQTIWVKPLYQDREAENRALYREVKPNYAIDYVFGVRKKQLDMYVDKAGTLSFRSFVKSFNGTEGVLVRFGFDDGSMAEKMVPFTTCREWLDCTIPLSDILHDDSPKKISALAFMAVCPNADPESLLRFGIDDIALTGSREVPWIFTTPPVKKLPEWPYLISCRRFVEGDKLTISGNPPGDATSAHIRIPRYFTGGNERTFTMKQTGENEWSVDIPLEKSSGCGAGFWKASVIASAGDSDIGITDMVFLVRLQDAPKGHPRLLLSPDYKETILARISTGRLKKVWNDFRTTARNNREKYNIEDFNLNLQAYDELHWLPTYGFYNESLRTPGKFVRENAVEYALSGNEEAGAAARLALLKVAGWPAYNHPHLVNQGQFSYYPCGQVLHDLSLGYDMVYDLLSPEERTTVREALYMKLFMDLWKEYVRDNRVSSNTSNWTSHITAGGILFSLAVMDDFDDENIVPYLAGMIIKMGELIHDTYDNDGDYGEGSSYCIFTLNTLSLSMASLERTFGVRFPEKVASCYRFLLYQTDAETKRIYDFGDTSTEFDGMTNFSYLIGKYRDPHLKWLYNIAPGSSDLELFFMDESVEAQGPEGLPACAHFKDVGTAIFRSGFGHDDFLFVFRCGPFYNHQHFDQGSFYLVDRGGSFIVETDESEGGDTISHYYSEPWYDKLFIQPGGHNCILVDENPESQRAGDFLHDVPAWKNSAVITDFITFDGGAFVSGSLESLYKGKLEKVTRSIFYIEPRTLIFIDEAAGSDSAQSINLRFHAPRKEDITIEDRRSTIERPYGSLTIHTAAPTDYTVEIKKRALGLLEFGSAYGKESALKTRGYLQLTAALDSGSTTVLNVLSTDTELMSTLETEESDGHVSIIIGGNTYRVNTSGEKTYSDEGITTDARVYVEKNDGYRAMHVTELVTDGTVKLKSDNPVCIDYSDRGTVNAVLSVSTDIEIKLSLAEKPREITVDGVVRNDWNFSNGELTLILSKGSKTLHCS